MYKLQFESGQPKLNHCNFLFSPLPPPSREAVETQLVCHCFSYVFCPKIARPVQLPSPFGCWCWFWSERTSQSVIRVPKYGGRGGLKKKKKTLSKGTFLMDDPLLVCGSMVGRKPLSHFHRGLLCTLQHTIISVFSPQINCVPVK